MSAITKEKFWRLSMVLTGHPELARTLSDEYFDIVAGRVGTAAIEGLLEAADGGQKDLTELITGHDHGPIAQTVIRLWFTGIFVPPDGTSPMSVQKPEHHFEALLWSDIGAHPPGLSGGYFGYWAYPAEN
jgi:hypothetical protein